MLVAVLAALLIISTGYAVAYRIALKSMGLYYRKKATPIQQMKN